MRALVGNGRARAWSVVERAPTPTRVVAACLTRVDGVLDVRLALELAGLAVGAVDLDDHQPVATAEALYRVVDAAYEKRSIALSSNLHPAGFDELMPKTIANATVDRLMHHAHVVLTAGDSISLTQATAGKGVTPLTR